MFGAYPQLPVKAAFWMRAMVECVLPTCGACGQAVGEGYVGGRRIVAAEVEVRADVRPAELSQERVLRLVALRNVDVDDGEPG